MIQQTILKESFHDISQDTKFIRLATITTFIHSVIFLLYLAYIAANTLSKGSENKVLSFLIDALGLANDINISLLIIIGIVLLIGYSILPPIGEGAMIYYLNNPKKQGTLSLGKGMTRFLQMFEFDAAISFFSIAVFLIAVSRFYLADILSNTLVIILLVIRLIIIFLAAFLLPYARYFIVLQKQGFFEAIRSSMTMSIEHFALTFQFIIVDLLLHVRFIINIIIVLGIPIGVIYLANWLGIADNGIVQTVFIILIVVLFLVTAYINGIIEAFFTTYRYKLYKHVLAEEEHTQHAIDNAGKPEELAVPNKEQASSHQHITINQYVLPDGSPVAAHRTKPSPERVSPDDEYTVSDTEPTAVSLNTTRDPQHSQKIPAPDGGHFIYVPPEKDTSDTAEETNKKKEKNDTTADKDGDR